MQYIKLFQMRHLWLRSTVDAHLSKLRDTPAARYLRMLKMRHRSITSLDSGSVNRTILLRCSSTPDVLWPPTRISYKTFSTSNDVNFELDQFRVDTHLLQDAWFTGRSFFGSKLSWLIIVNRDNKYIYIYGTAVVKTNRWSIEIMKIMVY